MVACFFPFVLSSHHVICSSFILMFYPIYQSWCICFCQSLFHILYCMIGCVFRFPCFCLVNHVICPVFDVSLFVLHLGLILSTWIILTTVEIWGSIWCHYFWIHEFLLNMCFDEAGHKHVNLFLCQNQEVQWKTHESEIWTCHGRGDKTDS